MKCVKNRIKILALGLMIQTAGCSGNSFQGGATAGDNKGGSSGSDGLPNTPESGGSIPNSPGAEVVYSDGITKVDFSGPSSSIMFRGTRGINLTSMTVGIPLNNNDAVKLQSSKGAYVASGLRTGAFNEWGMYVKSVTPSIVLGTTFTERVATCQSDEVVVGLPDRGVDSTVTNSSAVEGWKNRLICAKIDPKFAVKEVQSINYIHNYNMSVDCPGDSLFNGYDCGKCGTPDAAVLKCISIVTTVK